jgi:flagellar biosynthetic protein FliQ
MSEEALIQLARTAMFLTLQLAGPMLLFGLVVGLVVSVLQAVTQVQETSLSFIPKAVAVGIAFLVFMPWMIEKMTGFTRLLLGDFRAFLR